MVVLPRPRAIRGGQAPTRSRPAGGVKGRDAACASDTGAGAPLSGRQPRRPASPSGRGGVVAVARAAGRGGGRGIGAGLRRGRRGASRERLTGVAPVAMPTRMERGCDAARGQEDAASPAARAGWPARRLPARRAAAAAGGSGPGFGAGDGQHRGRGSREWRGGDADPDGARLRRSPRAGGRRFARSAGGMAGSAPCRRGGRRRASGCRRRDQRMPRSRHAGRSRPAPAGGVRAGHRRRPSSRLSPLATVTAGHHGETRHRHHRQCLPRQ
jgi:hypothetical protein